MDYNKNMEQTPKWKTDTPETRFHFAKRLIAWLIRIGQIKGKMPTDQEIREELKKR